MSWRCADPAAPGGISRRAALIGAAAALAAARPAFGAEDEARATLDRLAALPDYAARIAALRALAPAMPGSSAAIDLETVHAGLVADAALDALRPSDRRLPWSLAMPADAAGAWQLPAGDSIYALLLGRQLGATIAPDAAHGLLAAEVARLEAQADRLLRDLGHARGTTGARMRACFADSRFLYADSDAGRDQAVADMNAMLAAARLRLPIGFADLPPFCLDVAVERMPRAEEAARKQGYRRLPEPGRPGAYVVDLREIGRRPRWTLAPVVHHELLPGHMLQLPIEALAAPHPLRLAYLPAFPEGWAIHAEAWMMEIGGLPRDPRFELGQIHWLLFRALRGLIDTGIHHRRWSASKAQKTLEDVQGEPAYFADFASDIDRVIRDPGLRAAEALTWIRLRQLRKSISGGTGNAKFHRMLLANGRKRLDRLPLGV